MDFNENTQDLKRQIELRINSNNLDSTLKFINEVKEKNKDFLEADNYLAQAYIYHKDYVNAQKILQDSSYKNAKYYELLGEIAYKQNDYKYLEEIKREVDKFFPDTSSSKKVNLLYLLANNKYYDALEIIGSFSDEEFFEEKMEVYYRVNELDKLRKLARKTLLKQGNGPLGDIANKYLQLSKSKKIIEEDSKDSLEKSLNKLNALIGLGSVKREVQKIVSTIEYNKNRAAQGIVDDNKKSNHFAFYGNPGTGKTTVANLLGDIFKDLGILETNKVTVVGRSDLVAGYVGQTAALTKEKIDEAMGGILFIDEAYSLARGGENDFGSEAIDTLVKEMEDNRDKLIVVLAGYTDEMHELMKKNPGLKSRITNEIVFEDYNDDELLQIAEFTAKGSKYNLTENGKKAFMKRINEVKDNQFFANARSVRNIIEDAIKERALRIGRKSVSKEELTTLDAIDFRVDVTSLEEQDLDSCLVELNSLIGLSKVKQEVEEIKNTYIYNEKLKELGQKVASTSNHLIFTGNPGTGKTTVARILGKIYKNLGVVSSTNFVVADRSSLVGEYIGQTAPKTLDVIRKAYGGVLFIDEAYSLARGGENDFGKEAIDTLIKEMEDNRDKFVVIMAGYTKEMNDLINLNSGLRSRIKKIIEFEDYTEDEMIEIFESYVKNENRSIDEDARQIACQYLRDITRNKGKNFGNARNVRSFFERIKIKQASRIVLSGDHEILRIKKEDVIGAIEEI
ncbi:SpoVK/Ycf46/Vps4 family AAA+-type ATPase [Peptoniphilus koenoeneniae]|uniref:SpoVK/Ycf46/Vps4 family AAA+-type ATPase n=1 Tax=Peptoniphilus koenoeneniae TaxID=507751 RepID=A0ABU0AVM0_9FIRM|nr:AAA family ATPase [Peptoniphilus koenoeneniae]MDQ0275264.1 SpoVK/Ycf46/Vps4 family AAA+-type ATPase [Peptoniphilus koenoeneniae]